MCSTAVVKVSAVFPKNNITIINNDKINRVTKDVYKKKIRYMV